MTSIPCETIPAPTRPAAARVDGQHVTQTPAVLLTGGIRGEIVPGLGGQWYVVRAGDPAAVTHAA